MAENKEDVKAFLMFRKFYNAIAHADPKTVKDIILCFYAEMGEGERPKLGYDGQLMYDLMAPDIHGAMDDYKRRCNVNRENIKKRWSKQNNTIEYHRIPSNTIECNKKENNNKKEKENIKNNREHTVVCSLSSQSDDQTTKQLELVEIETVKKQPCPYKEIVALYHEAFPEGVQVQIIDGIREGAMKARWTDIGKRLRDTGRTDDKKARLEYFRHYFLRLAKNSFFSGKVPGKDGSYFNGGIDSLLRRKTFRNCIEGVYDER